MVLSLRPEGLTLAALEQRLEWYADVARLAPSKHNSQPWQFVIRDGLLEVYGDLGRSMPISDPRGRELRIACGAAVRAAEVAAAAIGAATTTALHEGGEHGCLAEIREIGIRLPERHDRELLTAVAGRRTDRGPLDITVLDAGLPFRLQDVAAEQGCVFRLISSPGDRLTMARAVELAHGMVLREPEMAAELADWVRPADDGRRHGVPATATRGLTASYTSEFVQRDFGLPGVAPEHDRIGVDKPLVGVLCTPSDTRLDWLMCGRGLMSVLLEATMGGASASYLNQPLELQRTRDLLRAELNLPGAPQLILRMGAGGTVAPTPRLAHDDVITRG